jgi:phosphonate transport system substrate-binding protein
MGLRLSLSEALLGGQIDIAWNGPLAHVRTKRRTKDASLSLGMRDCDCGFKTHILIRKDAGIKSLADLKDKRCAAGTRDSPQACVLPMQHLKANGVPLDSLTVTFFDKDLGKHGDTALGEIDVMSALGKNEADFGFVSDLMYQRALGSGEDLDALEILSCDPVPPFDHCQFDALPTLSAKKREDFERLLFAMDIKKAEHRPVMQAEGITERWERPREEGYKAMHDALADEPVVPMAGPLYKTESHPFKKMTVK